MGPGVYGAAQSGGNRRIAEDTSKLGAISGLALRSLDAGPRGMGNPSRMHPAPVTKSVLSACILLFTKAR